MKRERCVCKARGDSTAPSGRRDPGERGRQRPGSRTGTGHRGHRRDRAPLGPAPGAPQGPCGLLRCHRGTPHPLCSRAALRGCFCLTPNTSRPPAGCGQHLHRHRPCLHPHGPCLAPSIIFISCASPAASSPSPEPPQQHSQRCLHPHQPCLSLSSSPSPPRPSAFIPISAAPQPSSPPLCIPTPARARPCWATPVPSRCENGSVPSGAPQGAAVLGAPAPLSLQWQRGAHPVPVSLLGKNERF